MKQFHRCCMDVRQLLTLLISVGPVNVFCVQVMLPREVKEIHSLGFRGHVWCCPPLFKEQGPAVTVPRRNGTFCLCSWLLTRKPISGPSLVHGRRYLCLSLPIRCTNSRIQLLDGQPQSQILLASYQ